jgi:7-carboxy-7-deazaguanine synthase
MKTDFRYFCMVLETEESDESIFLMETFHSIQGEGFHSGRSAYFIRTAGCHVGCVWCDVKESWKQENFPKVSIQEITDKVVSSGTNFVVITGGEPTEQNLTALTTSLKKEGMEIAIETSGTNDLKGKVDWYCFSPKKFLPPVDEAYHRADELKIIIHHPSDFEWAEMHAEKLQKDSVKLYLQPEWERSPRFNNEIVSYVLKNPKWQISLQTHKFLNIP